MKKSSGLSLPIKVLWLITLVLLAIVTGRLYRNNRTLDNSIEVEIEAARHHREFAPFDLSALRHEALRELSNISPPRRDEVFRLLMVRSEPASAYAEIRAVAHSIFKRGNKKNPLEVWLITKRADFSLAVPKDFSEATRIHLRLFYLEEPVVFELRTGIRAMPATLLLGPEKHPLFLAFGTLEQSGVKSLADRITKSSRVESDGSFVYVRAGSSQDLQSLSFREPSGESSK